MFRRNVLLCSRYSPYFNIFTIKYNILNTLHDTHFTLPRRPLISNSLQYDILNILPDIHLVLPSWTPNFQFTSRIFDPLVNVPQIQISAQACRYLYRHVCSCSSARAHSLKMCERQYSYRPIGFDLGVCGGPRTRPARRWPRRWVTWTDE